MIEFTSWEDPVIGLEVKPFNWRLRKARKARGWSRAALAREAGIAPGTVGDAEKLQRISGSAREKIAFTLEIPEDVLFPGVIDNLPEGGPGSIEVPFSEEQVQRWQEGGALLSPDDGVLHDALATEVRTALGALSEREQTVLSLRFGLRDGEQHALSDIGDELGVSRERVRQLEAEALRKLRRSARANHLREFVRDPSDGPTRRPPMTDLYEWMRVMARRGNPEHVRGIANVGIGQPCCYNLPNPSELRLHIRDIHGVDDAFWPMYDDFASRWELRDRAKKGSPTR